MKEMFESVSERFEPTTPDQPFKGREREIERERERESERESERKIER